MNLPLVTVLLALGWCAATDSFTLLNLLFGAVLAGFVLYFARAHTKGEHFWIRLLRVAALVWLFIYELVLSAVRVAWLVVQPRLNDKLSPLMIEFPLTVTRPGEISLLANLITLTPGTLSVDVSEDGKTLLIHALRVDDAEAAIAEIRDGFETAVARAFQ
jgi:multicomponent Na+:H+ antiporter subunit E